MRRLIGLVLIAALMAPALAVCAGGMTPARPSSEHDCCPKPPASIAAAPVSSSATPACCRMSADAAQRGAIQAVDLAVPVTSGEIVTLWQAPTRIAAAPGHLGRPAESPHIARHLLLSVLLV